MATNTSIYKIFGYRAVVVFYLIVFTKTRGRLMNHNHYQTKKQ